MTSELLITSHLSC